MQNLEGMMSPQKLDEDVDDLSLGSQSSRSVSTSDTTDANAPPDARESELAKKETKLVERSKFLVLLVLFVAAFGCGACKLLLIKTENKSFHLSSYLVALPFFLATYLVTIIGEDYDFRDQVRNLKERNPASTRFASTRFVKSNPHKAILL
jgi:hypothetical protein